MKPGRPSRVLSRGWAVRSGWTAIRCAGAPTGPRPGRLLIPCLVHHQYCLVIGELTRDPAGRPVTHGIVVLHRAGQEVLQAVRAAVTEGFGQRLAVRPRHAHQHRLGHFPERLPRLAAREASRHQARHLPEAVRPHLLRYGCLYGRRILLCCHRRS